MCKNPTLEEIIQSVENLVLKKRKKAPQGRKALYSDSFVIALAIYQKLYSFKYAKKMLEVLSSLGLAVPSASSFSERKALLMGQIILAVKRLCSQQNAVKQHMDSKKLEIIDFARANRTKLAGSYGYDAIHKRTFFGLRLHARVNDEGNFCKLLLRRANQHDVRVAEDLVKDPVKFFAQAKKHLKFKLNQVDDLLKAGKETKAAKQLDPFEELKNFELINFGYKPPLNKIQWSSISGVVARDCNFEF